MRQPGNSSTRRNFLKHGGSASLAALTMPLWSKLFGPVALAQSTAGSYKAVVMIHLIGGNDGNNMLVPTDSAAYAEYAALRTSVAISQGNLIPLNSPKGSPSYGLHPSLINVGRSYNAGNALVVANAGPLRAPATKIQMLADPSLIPANVGDHPVGQAQWASAQTVAIPTTGWGGRMADFLVGQSGSLPPVLSAGLASIFTQGNTVQGIVIQANSGQIVALPAGINQAIEAIALDDSKSVNQIVHQAAELRLKASSDQDILLQAQSAGTPLRTIFPTTGFGNAMEVIARTINGRGVVGATRQIFYMNQGNYDTHAGQLSLHANQLSELDGALGAFMAALNEMGLADQVLVCTHSDFNRTMQANGTGGTDHAWANHILLLGGGMRGGRIIGSLPDLELGGSSDYGRNGIWIPTTSVTQVTAGIGSWLGLSSPQLASIFPDLKNFSSIIQLT